MDTEASKIKLSIIIHNNRLKYEQKLIEKKAKVYFRRTLNQKNLR